VKDSRHTISKENVVGKNPSLLRRVQERRLAPVASTRNNDNSSGGGDDGKDPTTLTSATTDAFWKTFFIAPEVALNADDGVQSNIFNVPDPLAPCSPRPSTSRSWCDLQPNILDTIILWILLLWYRWFPKPELGQHHEHPRRPEREHQLQGGGLYELLMASKVAGTQRTVVADTQERGKPGLSSRASPPHHDLLPHGPTTFSSL